MEEESSSEEYSSEEETAVALLQQISSMLGLRSNLFLRSQARTQGEATGSQPNPETKLERALPSAEDFKSHPLYQEIRQTCGDTLSPPHGLNTATALALRQQRTQQPAALRISAMKNRFPVRKTGALVHHGANVFCGAFSKSGDVYMSASQDGRVRMYEYPYLTHKRQVYARDIGWSIIDTDYSPDQRFLIYSSWSPYVHLCNVTENSFETHEALKFRNPGSHFCLFSIKFSASSTEIAGGSNDNHLYVYDLATNRLNLRLDAHDSDVNTVAFADDSPNILFSGSDDMLCKVWDRRALGDSKPVGVLAGHIGGITHISSKGDGRYFLSNSKDQTIKLWDLRKMSGPDTQPPNIRSGMNDYRYQHYRGLNAAKQRIQQDTSLMTYSGHHVLRTLIRAKFSPLHTTGQRYIYSGSADGVVRIWDILTGEVVANTTPHDDIVRDVSWHPYEPTLMSASWDGTVGIWGL